MRLRLLRHLVWAAWAVSITASALGPHELLVLVNPDSPESLAIANRFVELRGVPSENIVCLPLPPSASEAAAEITPEDFTKHIWAPASEIARRRGVADHALAWIFSAGFPTRLRTNPPVSITGAVFTRDQLPPADQVATGLYASVVFRGPAARTGEELDTISLDVAAAGLGARMPLPSMMLGWTGARGLTLEESFAVLDRSAASDATRPHGPIYLLSNDDVRSRCRDWQFSRVADQLADAGLRATTGERFPAHASGVAGLMIGAADPPIADIQSWAPGAFAEHLTSHAAEFQQPLQAKLTEWLRSGATCSAGTVAEPYAVWTKFPSARIFAHLGAGATMLEALAQSVASPMQLLAVGDPLARPWGARIPVTLDGPEEAQGTAVFRARAPVGTEVSQWMFLLDGRVMAVNASAEFSLRTAGLMPGSHTLRTVAYGTPPVCSQGWAERTIRIPSAHEPVTLRMVDASRPRVIAHAPGASRIAIYHWGRRVAELSGDSPEWIVPHKVVGAGKVPLQAVAQYPDGTMARSPQICLDIPLKAALPKLSGRAIQGPPRVAEIQISGDGASDDSPCSYAWRFTALEKGLLGYRLPRDVKVSENDEASMGPATTVRVRPGASNEVAVVRWSETTNAEWTAEVCWPDDTARMPRNGSAVLVWGDPATGTARFFGMIGTSSAWAWGDVANGKLMPRVTLGAPLRTGTKYRLSIRLSDDRKFVECRADGRLRFRVPAENSKGLGAPGLAAGKNGAEFSEIQFGIPATMGEPRQGNLKISIPSSLEGSREATFVLSTEDDEVGVPVRW